MVSDNELCMLEQLCYLDAGVVNAATGKQYSRESWNAVLRAAIGQKKTIAELFLEVGLTDAAIDRLAAAKDSGGFTSNAEWASILRHLKNSELSGMRMEASMPSPDDADTTLAIVYAGGDETIVAFKGTSGAKEWVDNVEGLNKADTECQLDALDFIESLPYDNITVTGHSKGANKSMYVAITSDKVGRCVAFDGQGFSQEFIDKYWAEIQLRGQNITNYSLDSDFVHVLLFPVPNSNQVYCQGFGVDKTGEQHAANSFFKTRKERRLLVDENGNPILDKNGNLQYFEELVLELDENGEPILVEVDEEAPGVAMLHDFTAFILNNADDEDKKLIIEYVGEIAALCFAGSASKEELMDAVFGDPETLAIVIAYLVKYMDEYDLDADDIDQLLEALNVNQLNDMIDLSGVGILGFTFEEGTHLNLAGILNMLKEQLTDKNDDFFLKKFLALLKRVFAKDLDLDVEELWAMINDKVKKIDTSGGKENAKGRTGTVRDYSDRVHNGIMDSVGRIGRLFGNSVGSWSRFAGEAWFSELYLGLAVKGFQAYFSRLNEVNEESARRVGRTFDAIRTADKTGAGKIENQNRILSILATEIKMMTI